MKLKHLLIFLLSLSFGLDQCKDYSSIDSITLTTIPQKELPIYLRAVSPWPGGTFSKLDYSQMALVPLYQGEEPGVCIIIGPYMFMEPGDFYSADEWINNQVELNVDNVINIRPNTISLTNSFGAEKWNLETGELEWKEPDGSPIAACYSIMLDVGLHNVTLEVRTTSGKVTSYSWAFVLTK